MLFPLEAVAESSGAGPLWPLILLAVAGAMVIFFLVVQLRRILRLRRGDEPGSDTTGDHAP